VAKTPKWCDRLNPDFPGGWPEAADRADRRWRGVVASKKSDTAKFLKKQYGDTLAVEMEGRGFLEAVHIHSLLGTVVRGISDLLSKKTVADQAGWQERAADAASAVAFEILARLNRESQAPARTGGAPVSDTRKRTRNPPRPEQPRRGRIGRSIRRSTRSLLQPGEVLARVGVPNVDESNLCLNLSGRVSAHHPGRRIAEPIAVAI